jgi:pimeloyl-ACP methyl ester carboxylesterase
MKAPSNYRTPNGQQVAMKLYDAAIARWPVPCESRVVATRYGDAFVLAFGRTVARPLVLLHGAASNSAMWFSDAAAYASRFRVFAVDIPGEAGKSAPQCLPWRGPYFSDWLGDVFDGVGLQSAAIAGVSQGGWLALKFGVEAPERVERLALVAPGGVVPDRRAFVLRAMLYARLRAWGARQITRMIYAPRQPPPGAAEAVAFMLRHFSARMDVPSLFSDEELRRISAPALLVGGEGDRLRDVAAIERRLSRLLPQLQSRLLPETGHAVSPTAEHTLAFLEAGGGSESGASRVRLPATRCQQTCEHS